MGMKLIFGEFPEQKAQAIAHAFEEARARGDHAILIPYYGAPIQVVDTSGSAGRPRRTSIQAHRGKPWVKVKSSFRKS